MKTDSARILRDRLTDVLGSVHPERRLFVDAIEATDDFAVFHLNHAGASAKRIERLWAQYGEKRK
jgi:hypothetical protein